MKLAKRTYALPPDTVSKFEAAVRPGQRSAKIAELIETWMQEQAREALRDVGCLSGDRARMAATRGRC